MSDHATIVREILSERGCGDRTPEDYDRADAALDALVARTKFLETELDVESLKREAAEAARDKWMEYCNKASARVEAAEAERDEARDAKNARWHNLLQALDRAEAAEAEREIILPGGEVCACFDETGSRQVRTYERCERCRALMEIDLSDDAAENVRLRNERDGWCGRAAKCLDQFEKLVASLQRALDRAEAAETALKNEMDLKEGWNNDRLAALRDIQVTIDCLDKARAERDESRAEVSRLREALEVLRSLMWRFAYPANPDPLVSGVAVSQWVSVIDVALAPKEDA